MFGLNSQEWMNLLRQLLTLGGGVLAGHGIAVSPDQISTIVTDVGVIVPAAVSLSSVGWSVWAHWNQKKVPEGALVVKPGAAAP